jgi:hypothetical protein
MTDHQSAGATPVVDGAPPAQSDPATPPAPEPATGVEGALGDAGKRALDAMKAERRAAEDRARKAEAELEQLRAAQLTEGERAIAQARREASAETERKWSARLRSAEVARQLQAAGATPDAIDLAVLDPSFAELVIDDDGRVAGLDGAIAAFRKARPSLFAAPRPAAGNFDGGSGGSPAQASWTRDQIGAMSQAEFERNEAEIMRAMREGRIRD